MTFGLEISGNNVSNLPQGPAGPKMAVGERLSMCGQFIISSSGQWRPVPEGQGVITECEFPATAGEKPLTKADVK